MKRRNRHGFAALPIVSAMALMFTLSLLMLFRAGQMHREEAAKSQLRADYHQREEAFLRALVAVFPQKAIASMRAGYAPADDYAWSTIFAESVTMANTAQALSQAALTTLGLESARSGDVGDYTAEQVQTWITSLTGEQDKVTPGTTWYSSVFDAPEFAGKVPPLLDMSQALQEADEVRPVVTLEKHYSTQAPGLLADVTKHPTYNLIAYPNIRFGYAAPGAPFVAKRNWWAFTVTFGAVATGKTAPVPTVSKHYVLSLYEIPSQLPIEAATFAEIGRHKDGAAWNAAAITITGGVYADQLSLHGGFGAARLAGKKSIQMAAALTLDGSVIGEDFDAAGVREELQVERRSEALPVALSANSGRLTFLPIQRGEQFLQTPASTPDAWETYSRGAVQCRVSVEAIAMVSLGDQTPTAIRVRYPTAAGGTVALVLQRGSNWPTQSESGGEVIPFQTELTDTNRSCLTFYPSLLNMWLVAQGGASVATSNSIRFNIDATVDPLTVKPLADPLVPDDMSIIIRKGLDLTLFTTGLAIVAPLRVYVGDDLNATPLSAPPAGSGLQPGDVFYPPMSIFAAELRIGTTSFLRPFEHHGQVSTLASGGTGAWGPLDVKSGSNDAVLTDNIAAELAPLRSPAELPPVHQMNWLVVIEEIQQQ